MEYREPTQSPYYKRLVAMQRFAFCSALSAGCFAAWVFRTYGASSISGWLAASSAVSSAYVGSVIGRNIADTMNLYARIHATVGE